MSSIKTSQSAASAEGTKGRGAVHSRFKMLRKFGTIGIIMFLTLYLWRSDASMGSLNLEWFSGDFLTKPSSTSPKSVDLVLQTPGQAGEVDLGLKSTLKVYFGRPRAGEAHSGCGEIINPVWLTKHKESPRWHLSYKSSQAGSWHNYQIPEDMQVFLAANGHATVTVKFTLTSTEGGAAVCKFSN